MTYRLTSTCDDAGNLLAARLDDPDYTRTVATFATADDAERAKQEYLEWYAKNGVQIGEGCLAIEEGEGTVIRWGEDGRFATLWNDGKFVRYADHAEMHGNTYTIGDNLTDAEIEALP